MPVWIRSLSVMFHYLSRHANGNRFCSGQVGRCPASRRARSRRTLWLSARVVSRSKASRRVRDDPRLGAAFRLAHLSGLVVPFFGLAKVPDTLFWQSPFPTCVPSGIKHVRTFQDS